MSRLFKIILNIELHLMKAIVIYREEIEKMKNHIRQADQTFNTKTNTQILSRVVIQQTREITHLKLRYGMLTYIS